MRRFSVIAALTLAALPALADGDAATGENTFKRCKACHSIADGDNVIYRGGRTGPNLFGVIGRQAGTVEGFNYGEDLVAAGEAGLVWNEENLAAYATDPREFLREFLDDGSARSQMTFKLRNGGEDIVAYLISVSPATEGDDATDTTN